MIPNQEAERSLYYHSAMAFALVVVGTMGLIAAFTVLMTQRVGSRIYPNVYINSYNVGNLTKEEAKKLLSRSDSRYLSTSVTVLYKSDPVATLSAKILGLKLDTDFILEEAYMIGRSDQFPIKIGQKLGSFFGLSKHNFSTSLQYDEQHFTEVITTAEDSYNKPAKNALFTFKDGRVLKFQPEANGVKIESTKFLSDVRQKIQTIKTNPRNISVSIEETLLKPEITLAQSNNFGIEELIGEGQSDYNGSIPGREHNVVLGTSKFNGVLIPKGETFSFNQTVGDISALTGYQPAYIIQNGKTVLGDGGGICQVSSTLFRAALNTGLPIISRTAHAYRVHYYENDTGPGFDATVFSPSVDLKIQNDTPAAILIQTSVDEVNRLVYFKLYGKKDGRKVEVSKAEVWDVSPPPEPSYEDDPTLQRGITKQIDFGAWGAKARFSYKVTYPTNEVKDEIFYSVYRPWKAIFMVGTKDS